MQSRYCAGTRQRPDAGSLKRWDAIQKEIEQIYHVYCKNRAVGSHEVVLSKFKAALVRDIAPAASCFSQKHCNAGADLK